MHNVSEQEYSNENYYSHVLLITFKNNFVGHLKSLHYFQNRGYVLDGTILV